MRISVIICTYGIERFDDVIEAIHSVNNQNYQGHEIIVVIDKNETLYRKLHNTLHTNVRIVVSPVKGLSNARNIGIKNSKNEIIAFLDDDAIADSKWLTTIVKDFDDSNVVAVGGKIEPLWINGRPKWFPEELDWIVGCTYKGHPEERCLVRNVIGCNMAFRKDVFQKVGYFSNYIGRYGTKLLACEEMELCVRVSRTLPNAKILYDPKAKVFHKVHSYRQTYNYLITRAYNEGLSKAKISKQIPHNPNQDNFITESQYFKYLLIKAIPVHFMNIPRMKDASENLAKIFVIISVIMAVFMGYSSKLKSK